MSTIFVTAGQVPSQPVTVVTIVPTTSNIASSPDSGAGTPSQNSLPVSWILVIVVSVLLAILGTYTFILYRQRGKKGYSRDNGHRETQYYEMSRNVKTSDIGIDRRRDSRY